VTIRPERHDDAGAARGFARKRGKVRYPAAFTGLG
jgi:hypothetical protein